jgi:heat-inducible transcriptional repressor
MELIADTVSRKLSELTGEMSAVVLSRGGRPGRYRIYVQGSSTMLEKPEFQDLAKFRSLLQAFEEKAEFAAWLTGRSSGPRATVSIGRENDREVFSQCSVVLAHQEMEEGTAATVAVLGPLRMRYGKTMPLVEQMGRIIKQWIEECER